MIREIEYKDFSREFHKSNYLSQNINVCQFELTFACNLHCRHCYTDCFNRPDFIKKELNTSQIKNILDRVYKKGILWLCFTGGEPFMRSDFLEIYAYAKKKGFIITIFTNGTLLDKGKCDFLKEHKPFCVEVTLNGVTQKTYEAISGIGGSFHKAMRAIDMIIKHRIPLKIKAMLIQQNKNELKNIKDFAKTLGAQFSYSAEIFPRLNKDTGPCQLRLDPREIIEAAKGLNNHPARKDIKSNARKFIRPSDNLFRCAAGRDTVFISAYGEMLFCNTLRSPSVNLLSHTIDYGIKNVFANVIEKKFKTDSKCRRCRIFYLCHWCPAKAEFETGNKEEPLDFFCNLARLCHEEWLSPSK